MSIGPQPTEETVGVGAARRTVFAVKKTAQKIIAKPLFYIFYLTLIATIIGLLLGIEFGWQLYVILACLGIVQCGSYIFNSPLNESDHGSRSTSV